MNSKSIIVSDIGRRLIYGFGATALGPIVTAIIQLGTVPLLLHAWGATKYGDWLLLSAIPSYFILTDLGFGNASGSDMTVRVAAGDKRGALETFQSSWVLLTAISLAVLAGVWISAGFIPWHNLLHLSTVSDKQAAGIILFMTAYVLLIQQSGIFESGFRCDGNYALGSLFTTILRLVETLGSTAVGLLTGSFLYLALTVVVMRCLGTIAYALLMLRKSPWLKFGFEYARMKKIKELAPPALSFMAIPAGSALTLQGSTIVVGAVLGPIALTAFSTIRTLSRVVFQVLNVISLALWPELSTAFGAGKIALARTLHRRACQVAIWLSALSGVFLWTFGGFLYNLWIRKAVVFDNNCFHIFIVVVAVNALWSTSSVVPMSTNAHQRIAMNYLAATSISLLLAWYLVHPLGISGAAIAVLVVDSWMTIVVLKVALTQVEDSLAGLGAAILDFKFFGRASHAILKLRAVPAE
jgi:O-antigen/teichoic acid export membrane protein